MNDHTLTLAGRIVAGASSLIALLAIVVLLALGSPILEASFLMATWAIGMGLLAWVTISAQPRNGVVWAFVASSAFGALGAASGAVFTILVPESIRQLTAEAFYMLSPSDLEPQAALAVGPAFWAWAPAFFLVLTVVLQLFPDGKLVSPRWRWLLWLSFISIVLAVLPTLVVGLVPSHTVRFDYENAEEVVTGLTEALVGLSYIAWLLSVPVVILGSLAALLVRYRRSGGATRHQIRWILWAGVLLGLVMLFVIVEEETALVETSDLVSVMLLGCAELLVIASFWVAITKYRLYDIDVVISRTVTYGALAVFITAVYVAIVVGLGNLLGQGDDPNLVLRIGAIAAVALLFEPVRSRVQRWANRLVYGKRATPYEVLARFSSGAATETDDEVLGRIPRLIVDGTGAAKATLWTVEGERMRPEAWWPDDAAAPAPSGPVVGSWRDGAADYSVLVEHRGEILGALSLVAGRGEALAPAEEELMQNLAGGLGLAMRNARLTDDLRQQVAALADSRERILTAADEARRDLERDLDMGPQQELVAVKVKLGVVRSRAERQEALTTAQVLGQLEEEVGTAITSVRDFARGVYPPLLEADGLNAAVSAEADKAALPVSVVADDVGRYSREVETAVFFTVLEALQNAAKYAEPTAVEIRLTDERGRLTFEVADDGSGFDPGEVGEGSGIPGMRDRIDAAGGRLSVRSAPGGGTTISGFVPVTAAQPAAPA